MSERERPEIRGEWSWDPKTGLGKLTEQVYFRKYACRLEVSIEPVPSLGIVIARVYIDGDMVHTSEHDGTSYAKDFILAAASRAIKSREAVCE